MTAVQQVFSDLEKLQPHLFNEGKIAAPIHLYSGNEELIMEI